MIAAAADRALASQLVDSDLRGHVARTALAVYVRRVRLPDLPDLLCADVADVLEWVEGAPSVVVRDALEHARALVAARAWPPFHLVGALARWRRELADGTRQFGDTDPLASAARWEQVALEREAEGDRAGALDALDEAGARVLELRAGPALARAARTTSGLVHHAA